MADLEKTLDELVASYQTESAVNTLATGVMPNRAAVVKAFKHLQHLLFLGYQTSKTVSEETLRLALGEHLLEAHGILCKQIQNAVWWHREACDRNSPCELPEEGSAGVKGGEEGARGGKRGDRRLPDCSKDDWCQAILSAFFAELPCLRRKLAEDVEAAFMNDPAAPTREDVIFSYPGLLAVTAYRVAHELYKHSVPMLPRILTEYAHSKTGIDIHPGASIGRRFFIDHGTGVVIGATTVIGDSVVLYQGVTLGALHVDPDAEPKEQRHPTIEDHVTIYAGATVLGGKTVVGAHSTIGGNVWLIKSVPPYSQVYNVNVATDVREKRQKGEAAAREETKRS